MAKRSTVWRAAVAGLALAGGLAAAGGAAAQGAIVPDPLVEGPVTGGVHGRPWFAHVEEYLGLALDDFGYVEEEFFVSGTSDEQTPFKTRIVVRRPTDPAQFSGTVFIEWVNVTAQQDLETLWPAGHPVLLDEGHVFVAMSAQAAGVRELIAWDPVRYGTLDHPGDDPHSFRIMEQCIRAVRNPVGIDPMGGLDAEYVIVAGDSQSAGRITSYIGQGYEIEGLIDAWLPGRGGTNAFTRLVMEELEMPMIVMLEESQAERPADSEHYRVFYGAGQSHAPWDWASYVHAARVRDLLGGVPAPSAEDAAGRAANGGTGGINRSYSRMMVRAGIHWINRMVRGQGDPPFQPRLLRDAGGDVLRDADGHALGGIRYPDVEVPIGLNTAEGLALFGIFDPWTAEEIVARYPTRQTYLDLVEDAIDAITPSGMLRPADADEIRADAAALPVWDGAQARACYNESWGFPPDLLNPCLSIP